MILNNSRSEAYDACKTLAYNQDELGFTARRTADPLLIGGAFHKAKALLGAGNSTLAQLADAAEREYRDRSNWDDLLKEERAHAEENIRLVRSMVRAYAEHWINENYEVLAPEVSFLVALPNSEHHCYYAHKLLHPGEDPKANESCSDLRCFIPHYLTGTSDAIIQWNRAIWLQEHKTTAYDLYNDAPQSKNWIANWQLSTQATCYIYGIWKSLGVQPHGVMLNVVIKPRKNAIVPTFTFYREAFLRSTEQLLKYEIEQRRRMDDYELRMRTGSIWKNPHACFRYNRRCDFHANCVAEEAPSEPEFIRRPDDYVKLSYYKVLNLPLPKESNASASESAEATDQFYKYL